MMTNICGKSEITYVQIEEFIKSIKTANKLALELLPIFWKAAEKNGIKIEILYSQALLETGYFNFGGVLNASYHNTCGLKITKGGGDKNANAHMRFKTWEDGIQAHADHLALYAGAPKFPKYSPNCASHLNEKYKANGTTQDPRHFTYLYGCCKTVEGLSGTWATNKKYAEDLKKIIKQIQNTKVVDNTPKDKDITAKLVPYIKKGVTKPINKHVMKNITKDINKDK